MKQVMDTLDVEESVKAGMLICMSDSKVVTGWIGLKTPFKEEDCKSNVHEGWKLMSEASIPIRLGCIPRERNWRADKCCHVAEEAEAGVFFTHGPVHDRPATLLQTDAGLSSKAVPTIGGIAFAESGECVFAFVHRLENTAQSISGYELRVFTQGLEYILHPERRPM